MHFVQNIFNQHTEELREYRMCCLHSDSHHLNRSKATVVRNVALSLPSFKASALVCFFYQQPTNQRDIYFNHLYCAL